jgi:hypothetical protein
MLQALIPHALAASKSHRPGKPLSSYASRSSNSVWPGYEIRDDTRYEDFLGPGICHDPGRRVDCDAPDIVPLTSISPYADPNAEAGQSAWLQPKGQRATYSTT